MVTVVVLLLIVPFMGYGGYFGFGDGFDLTGATIKMTTVSIIGIGKPVDIGFER